MYKFTIKHTDVKKDNHYIIDNIKDFYDLLLDYNGFHLAFFLNGSPRDFYVTTNTPDKIYFYITDTIFDKGFMLNENIIKTWLNNRKEFIIKIGGLTTEYKSFTYKVDENDKILTIRVD